jgi:ABC-type multidrug transport system fused ATPase/permease subunit
LRRIAKFVKPYIGYIILAALASVGSAAASVWIIDLLKRLIDESLNGNIQQIWGVSLEGIAAILVGMVATYAARYTTEYFGAGVLRDLRFQTIRHISGMAPDYTEKNNYGDIITRMTSDLGGIADYMEQFLKDWIYLPFMVLVYSIYLLRTNWVLAAVSIAPVFVLVPLSIVLMKPIKLDQRQYTIDLGLTNNNIQEVCDGILEVKSYNLENFLKKKYYKALYKTFETSNRNDIRQYNMEPISLMIGRLPVYISLCLGGYLVFSGNITIGIMVAFVSLIKKFVTPLESVYGMVIKGQVAMIGVQRVLDILEAPMEADMVVKKELEEVDENTAKDQENMFCLSDVSFAYSGSTNTKSVLNHINLKIRRGEKTALVGRSGGGKSTLLKLLYRHYTVKEGKILCCGVDYDEINPLDLREHISLISQDCYLFPMSIKDNIRIGRADATDEDIKRAARLANCEEFIETMPQGYDSMVGEKGTLLSGGQKQRISIARAILKDASIILLDEPTSALDQESEAKVNEAIDRVTQNRTVVVVAHRLTTITNADKIVVVDHGRIVEEGTHESLLANHGLYEQLYLEYVNGREALA